MGHMTPVVKKTVLELFGVSSLLAAIQHYGGCME